MYFVDLTDLYHNAYEAARKAVETPDSGWQMANIAPESEWPAIAGTGMLSLALNGTFTGAMDGLRERGASIGAALGTPDHSVPNICTVAHVAQARSWITNALSRPADPEADEDMIRQSLREQPELDSHVGIASMMFAVMMVAGHIINTPA